MSPGPRYAYRPCPACDTLIKRLSAPWALGWLRASGHSTRGAAREMGISHSYLNDMLHGRKAFTEEMERKFLAVTGRPSVAARGEGKR